MFENLLENIKSLIKTPAPEKFTWDFLYNLVKESIEFCVVNFQLFIVTTVCCYVLIEQQAILLIRAAFEDPNWQPILAGSTAKKIVSGLKLDPDLQKPKDVFYHSYYIRISNGVWDINRN